MYCINIMDKTNNMSITITIPQVGVGIRLYK